MTTSISSWLLSVSAARMYSTTVLFLLRPHRHRTCYSTYLFALYLDDLTVTCLSAPGVCVILYADDILLIAPSVCGLDALTKTCEIDLNKLDTVINTRKSCCLRIGPRNNASCLPVSLSAGTVISWVDEIRYQGIFIVRSRTFKCSLEHAKSHFIVQRMQFLQKLVE